MMATKFQAGQQVLVAIPSSQFERWQGRLVTILEVAAELDHAHGQAYLVRSQIGEQAWMWESWLSAPKPQSAREEFITGLRQLADFLTVNPDVPVPRHATTIQIGADGGSDDERRAAVDRAALAMGVEAFDPFQMGEHWKAELRFGPVSYYVLAIDAQHMADYNAVQRLGAEALERQKAEVAR